MTGTLYGIGVGPGDPELITLKAVRVLREAAVVAYPAPLEGDSMARGIAAAHIPAGKTEIAIRLPFTPERGGTEERYEAAADALCAHLAEGRDVAVLCLGDPLFYGTFAHLLPRIAGKFPVHVVPGVTAVAAASAAAGLPSAVQDETLTVIPATLDEETLTRKIEAADSAAIIKIGRHFAKLKRVVEKLGLSEHARYVEYAATGREKVAALADIAEANAEYFALVIIRKGTRP